MSLCVLELPVVDTGKNEVHMYTSIPFLKPTHSYIKIAKRVPQPQRAGTSQYTRASKCSLINHQSALCNLTSQHGHFSLYNMFTSTNPFKITHFWVQYQSK